MKRFLLLIIRFYQQFSKFKTSFLSNIFPANTISSMGICRFNPTCSQYAYQAIERYGIVRGIVLSVKRILNCHPWSKGGYDPLPKSLKAKS